MASIREAARDVLDVARDGIGWIALWKEGRGWWWRVFWPDFDPWTRRITFSDKEDVEELREISQMDPGAIVVNSYIHNLGCYLEGSAKDLAEGLKWQYRLQNYLVVDAIS
ncbi:MAG: hypothetical protein IJT00_08400 [Lachnospiraceae bacterium]|nr:hypothetical protein [Lachnospiraceae bacterium]